MPILAFPIRPVIDWIMSNTMDGRLNGLHWTLWTQMEVLDFADGLALLSHIHTKQDKTIALE